MFDSVRTDMEKHAPKPPKMVRIKEDETISAPSNNTCEAARPCNSAEPAPFSGRRHTIANLWAPFPDGKGPCQPPGNLSAGAPNAARRMSVIDRVRQYMSPLPRNSDGVSIKGTENKNSYFSRCAYNPLLLRAQTLPTQAIAACILNTVAIARAGRFRTLRAIDAPITK